jgi:hypothetical protein
LQNCSSSHLFLQLRNQFYVLTKKLNPWNMLVDGGGGIFLGNSLSNYIGNFGS